MESKQRILITILIVAILIIGFFLVTEAITKFTGFAVTAKSDVDDFKSCLREKEIILYVNTDNLVRTLKEIVLEDYLEDIEIVNCLRNNQNCLEKGVSSFPSWIIVGILVEGDIKIERLSELSGCNLVG